MRIAITGATGMLGQALCKVFSKNSIPLSSQDLDITQLEPTRRLFSALKPDWVIHAAAFTKVDEAELDAQAAYRVNALGTRNVALAAQENETRMVYFSTDYVFDGRTERPYREWDPTNPLSVYGGSKLAGEFFIRSLLPRHLIVRTSWLFGAGGSHFIGKILEAAQVRTRLEVVSDQRGTPTFTGDLAHMTQLLVEGNKLGTYHVTNSGDCSWHELACEVVALRGLNVEVHPTDSASLSNPAPRPSFSVLENCLLQLEGIPLLRSWRSAVEAFLTSPGSQD